MKYLCDTHAFLWYVTADSRLGQDALAVMSNAASALFLSHASLWEMSIKVSVGKLSLPGSVGQTVGAAIQKMQLQIADLRLDHYDTLATLPFLHRDPFDRMLAAQCKVDGFVLLSTDSVFDQYGIQRIW